MMAQALALSQNMLRMGGLAFAVIGFWVVYFVQA